MSNLKSSRLRKLLPPRQREQTTTIPSSEFGWSDTPQQRQTDAQAIAAGQRALATMVTPSHPHQQVVPEASRGRDYSRPRFED